jgi:stage V sporulation protein G
VEITEIRVTLRDEDRLKGFANVTFDSSFVVRGMKIIEGNDGLFVSMPSRKRSNGTYQDIAHPINRDMRELIEKSVLKAFEEEVESRAGNR